VAVAGRLPRSQIYRQALYAQRYFKEKFGMTARVGNNVDSFGHSGMLPQILKKSGLDYYVFMRPSPHEKALPGRLFWWESDDCSRVMAFRIQFEYCTGRSFLRSGRPAGGPERPQRYLVA
jgi:alpha-mannosidase